MPEELGEDPSMTAVELLRREVERIKEARGLTLDGLQRVTGMHRSSWNRLLKGESSKIPDREEMERFCRQYAKEDRERLLGLWADADKELREAERAKKEAAAAVRKARAAEKAKQAYGGGKPSPSGGTVRGGRTPSAAGRREPQPADSTPTADATSTGTTVPAAPQAERPFAPIVIPIVLSVPVAAAPASPFPVPAPAPVPEQPAAPVPAVEQAPAPFREAAAPSGLDPFPTPKQEPAPSQGQEQEGSSGPSAVGAGATEPPSPAGPGSGPSPVPAPTRAARWRASNAARAYVIAGVAIVALFGGGSALVSHLGAAGSPEAADAGSTSESPSGSTAAAASAPVGGQQGAGDSRPPSPPASARPNAAPRASTNPTAATSAAPDKPTASPSAAVSTTRTGVAGAANCNFNSDRTQTMAKGMVGSKVKQIQCLLDNNYGQTLPVDGNFGSDTETAVKAVQTCSGIPADGQVGPTTWAYLDHPKPACGH